MKALAMKIDHTLKASKHWPTCIRCGHLNNGERNLDRRICICREPILIPTKQVIEMLQYMTMAEIKAGKLGEPGENK